MNRSELVKFCPDMALLDAGMEDFGGTFGDFSDAAAANWLDAAIQNTENEYDIKVEQDIWQAQIGAAPLAPAAAQPALPPPMEQAADPPAWPAQPACDGYSGSSSGSSTASASPSRMQADMLDDMMDLSDLGDMPCDLELPDCFSGLNSIPDTVDTFDPDTAMHGADVMFSSSLSFNKPNRNRDNSLTLSECADSLFKELDILGTSPNSSNNLLSNAFFDTPMASEAGSSDNSDQEEEEEVEVVDNKTIVANNTTYYVSGKKSSKSSKGGKSLLRKNNKASYNERPRPSTSILESAQLDHCYYSTQPPLEVEATNIGSAGTPLTPTASSDDECERQGRPRSLLGKRKHINEANNGMDDGELKFKFRMKFGSSYSPDRRRGKGDHIKGEDETAASQQR